VAKQTTAFDTGGFTKGPISLAPGRPPSREVIVLRAEGGVWQRDSDWLSPEPTS
jgi:hypothetical protein